VGQYGGCIVHGKDRVAGMRRLRVGWHAWRFVDPRYAGGDRRTVISDTVDVEIPVAAIVERSLIARCLVVVGERDRNDVLPGCVVALERELLGLPRCVRGGDRLQAADLLPIDVQGELGVPSGGADRTVRI